MSYKKNGLLKLDLTTQRTSSYLSGKCGKISFRTCSYEDENSTSSPFNFDDSTLKLYFNKFHPKRLPPIPNKDFSSFNLPFSSPYIIYDENKELGLTSEILYVNFEKMIEMLVSSDINSDEIFEVCLYGYLSFTDDETVFLELIKRFYSPFPINMSKSEKKRFYFQKIEIMQRKIIVFLQFWVEIYKETMVLEKSLDELLEETIYFFYEYAKEYEITMELSKLLIKLEEIRVYKNFKKFNETNFISFKNTISSCLTEIIHPINYYIMKYPNDIVEQICIFGFDSFYRISIPELLKKNMHGGESYNYFAKNFNNLSKIISFLLLRYKCSHKRINFFEKITEMIESLIKYNNYNSAFAFFLALSHPAIDRLNNIIYKKISKKDKVKHEKYANLFSSSDNYFHLRDAQKNMAPPCVPFLGIYVKDLLNFEENSKLNNSCKDKKMIDFRKSSQISVLIKQIDSFKEVWYDFEKNEEIYNHFKYLPDMPDDLLYELSYIISPSS